MYITLIRSSDSCKGHTSIPSQLFQLKLMNAMTYEQARLMAKLARGEPVSPKSLEILNKAF
jgi:hypothetical protein